MIRLAKKAIESEKEQQNSYLAYLKGVMHYKNEDFERAISEFGKSDNHEAHYMSIVANLKLGQKDEAFRALWHYTNIVEHWRESKAKEEAFEKISRLKELLE